MSALTQAGRCCERPHDTVGDREGAHTEHSPGAHPVCPLLPGRAAPRPAPPPTRRRHAPPPARSESELDDPRSPGHLPGPPPQPESCPPPFSASPWQHCPESFISSRGSTTNHAGLHQTPNSSARQPPHCPQAPLTPCVLTHFCPVSHLRHSPWPDAPRRRPSFPPFIPHSPVVPSPVSPPCPFGPAAAQASSFAPGPLPQPPPWPPTVQFVPSRHHQTASARLYTQS